MTGKATSILVDWPSDEIVIVRLNRPEYKNALNLSIRQELAQVFNTFVDHPTLRCVILTGNEQSFAAGADIEDMSTLSAIEMYHRHTERLWAAIGDCPLPVIAAVQGYALGGGLELAMNADIIIAGQSAKLGQPEVQVGIMPGAGGTQRLTRAVGKFQAMYLCLTGEIITAKEALKIGLVSRVVDDEQVLDEAMRIAKRLTKLPPVALQQIKEVILLGADAPLETALALERKAVQILFASEDKKEGMQAFLEKRRPQYVGR